MPFTWSSRGELVHGRSFFLSGYFFYIDVIFCIPLPSTFLLLEYLGMQSEWK